MEFYGFEEIACLKDSDIIFRKIEEIKNFLHEKNCATGIPSYVHVKNKEMSFDIRISFPLPCFENPSGGSDDAIGQ